MDDFALTLAERLLLAALNNRHARFFLIGLGAAMLEGAPVSTQDLDLWLEHPGRDDVRQAAADAGGFWLPGFGVAGLERVDVVLTAHGLDPFDVEYARALDRDVDGIPARVLPLDRVVAKQARHEST